MKKHSRLSILLIVMILALPAACQKVMPPMQEQAIQRQDFDWLTAKRLTVYNAAEFRGSVTLPNPLTVSVPVTFTAAVDLVGPVTNGGLTQYVYTRGVTTTVATGTVIAHGLGTTPTVIFLQPVNGGQYYTVQRSDTISFSVGVSGTGVAATGLYWLASK